ncbi:SLC13 family permease [Denitrobacterium detoxificans]|jgi:Na+/H+ antiporter NhaD/arsenite permease-like protein|uniref:SLC13 family permease n=1 Tax=Denitrobacterium detoxificans TaxID=79604 RepID=UPI0026F0EF02|nr:SLC13 family permease [Denitrobacterium detoxificans]MBE6466619.1 citrate transporter [Denitrobacterium detoxificans]
MLNTIRTFVHNHAMLCVAAVAALVTSVFAMPSWEELGASIDVRVIALLFCLMVAVAGLVAHGALSRIARRLIAHASNVRKLYTLLVFAPFFVSMLVTNDVALLAFVPLTVTTLLMADRRGDIAHVAVAQAVAANLGSMVTPFGNPQNLFIYLTYDVSAWEFACAIAPYCALSFVLIALRCVAWPKTPVAIAVSEGKRAPVAAEAPDATRPASRSRVFASERSWCAFYLALFVFGVLAVVRLVPWQVACVVVALCVALLDRATLKRVDWSLLATFVCFFVFSGNMARIPAIEGALTWAVGQAPFATSLLASQVISNVPSAVLLSHFTVDWHALLLGVDLGGLGTPVASLASLIALRAFRLVPGSTTREFMVPFLKVNAAFLACLVIAYALVG